MVELMPEGGIQRRKHERVFGGDPRRDGVSNHPVDVAVLGNIVRILVVRAEGESRRPELLDER